MSESAHNISAPWDKFEHAVLVSSNIDAFCWGAAQAYATEAFEDKMSCGTF
ncbi:hypothetical protein [Tateyamaria sp.]|uniref:hypothetical protein n=1 Tax=Tateyamaria sp. TaxID=1929288 RepID=UPI003294670B